MSSKFRSVLTPILVAVLLATAGCTTIGGDSSPDARTIQTNAAESMDALESYQADVTITRRSGDTEITSNVSGNVSVADRKLRLTTESLGQTQTIYVFNETLYVQSNERWASQQINSEEYWNQTYIDQQQQFTNMSNASVNGTDTIDGQEVYVLTFTPTDEELQRYFEQGEETGQSSLEDVTYENVTIIQYVDTETYHVRRTRTSVNVTVGERKSRIEMAMTFSNLNESVDVQLPDDAPAK